MGQAGLQWRVASSRSGIIAFDNLLLPSVSSVSTASARVSASCDLKLLATKSHRLTISQQPNRFDQAQFALRRATRQYLAHQLRRSAASGNHVCQFSPSQHLRDFALGILAQWFDEIRIVGYKCIERWPLVRAPSPLLEHEDTCGRLLAEPAQRFRRRRPDR